MAESAEPMRLTLNPDNPCNTKIIDADGNILYIVYTEHSKKASTTRVSNHSGGVLASLMWSDGLFGDKVTLGDQPQMALSNWLHKSMIPFVDDISFRDDTGRKYKWKGYAPGRALQLHTEEDGFKEPIASFERSRRKPESDPRNPLWTHAQLLLTSRALEICDVVVTSFLFLERSRRTNEVSNEHMTNGMMAGGRWGAVTAGM